MCFTPNPGLNQICVVSVVVSEYRNNLLIGTQIREMQVVINASCSNTAPYAGNVAPSCGQVGGMVITYQGPSVTQADSNSIIMCPGDSICFQIPFSDADTTNDNITITTNVGTAIPGATFSINNNGTQTPTAYFCWTPTPLDSGLNIITIKAQDDACPISAASYYTYDITVLDQPYAGLDQTICGPQTAQLQAVGGGGGYVWNVLSGDTISSHLSCTTCSNPVASPIVTTTYQVTSTATASCISTDTVVVFVVPDFNQSATVDTSICVFGGTLIPVQLQASPDSSGYVYDWDNGATLSDSTISNPIATPTNTTNYIVTITSAFGCVKSDTATIQVTNFPSIIITGDTTIVLTNKLL